MRGEAPKQAQVGGPGASLDGTSDQEHSAEGEDGTHMMQERSAHALSIEGTQAGEGHPGERRPEGSELTASVVLPDGEEGPIESRGCAEGDQERPSSVHRGREYRERDPHESEGCQRGHDGGGHDREAPSLGCGGEPCVQRHDPEAGCDGHECEGSEPGAPRLERGAGGESVKLEWLHAA